MRLTEPITPSLVAGLMGWLLWSTTGFSQPLENTMEATLAADEYVYSNVAISAVCPPCTTNVPPCELPCYFQPGTNSAVTFTFQVTNASPAPRIFAFRSGQQFDIQLIDTSGELVAAWSDGRAFAQAATTIRFAPHESRTFDAAIRLQDRSGNPLAGTYTAYAYLTSAEPKDVAAAATKIEVVFLPPATSWR
jgi:hypothetical protein